jgi:hypothetical protein
MKKVTILYSLALTAFLVGCGGSSSNDDSSTKYGYFIDSPVKGLHYHTSSGYEGTTDKDGKFKYKNDDSVSFSIGRVVLGEAHPREDGLITPKELSKGDKNLESLLLRTLQSFDENHDPEDGIVIPKNIVDELSNLPKEEHFSKFKKDEDLRKVNQVFDSVVEVSESSAKEHFNNSLSTWRDKHKGVEQKHEETHQENLENPKQEVQKENKPNVDEVQDIMDDMYTRKK